MKDPSESHIRRLVGRNITAKAAKKREYLRLEANVRELGFNARELTEKLAKVVSRPKARTPKLQL